MKLDMLIERRIDNERIDKYAERYWSGNDHSC